MNQITSRLRRATNGYVHWCPGCQESHTLPDSWTFNGNVERPTFSPSFLHRGVKFDEIAKDWPRDAAGNTIPYQCHYILTDAVLNFCSDCSHDLAGKSVPLPELPPHLRDAEL